MAGNSPLADPAGPPPIFASVLGLMQSQADPEAAWPPVREAIVANRATFGCGAWPEAKALALADELFEVLCRVMAVQEGRTVDPRAMAAMQWFTDALRRAALDRQHHHGAALH